MKVKYIYFIPSIPGQPVYEMENGDLRIPFPDTKLGIMTWCSEKEALKAVVSKNIKEDTKNQKYIREQFRDIRIQIGIEQNKLSKVN